MITFHIYEPDGPYVGKITLEHEIDPVISILLEYDYHLISDGDIEDDV